LIVLLIIVNCFTCFLKLTWQNYLLQPKKTVKSKPAAYSVSSSCCGLQAELYFHQLVFKCPHSDFNGMIQLVHCVQFGVGNFGQIFSVIFSR